MLTSTQPPIPSWTSRNLSINYYNNNNNTNDNVKCYHHARIHSVHVMNTEQRRVLADLWTKATGLKIEARIPLHRLPWNFPVTRVVGKSATCHRDVANMDHVTGKFRVLKPSQHVQMAWKIPVTSRQPAHLCWVNGEIGDVRNKTLGSRRRRSQMNGDVKGLSRTWCRCHGEVGIVEFELKSAYRQHVTCIHHL